MSNRQNRPRTKTRDTRPPDPAITTGTPLRAVTFTREIRAEDKHIVFKKGECFDFRPVTLLVGDQGCGKSTLLDLLADRRQGERDKTLQLEGQGLLHFFDFEHMNPRIGREVRTANDIFVQWRSHGEVVLDLLRHFPKIGSGVVAMLDEPDTGLSPRSCHWLVRTFSEWSAKGMQIIAAVHNPILINSQAEVLSLEHRRWMPSVEFLASQTQPATPQ